MNAELRMGRTEWALLVLLSVLWGGSFFFAKVALGEIPAFTLVFARVALASGALGLLLRVLRKPFPRGRGVWGALFAMGLLNNVVPFSLLFWGQTEIGAGLAAILTATTPVFSVLVAHFFTSDERMSWTKLLGVTLGTLGVAAMIGIDIDRGVGGSTILAMVACLAAALSYGFATVYGRRFRAHGLEPLTIAFGQVTASTLMILPIALSVDRPWTLPTPSSTGVAAVLALALLSTALAYVVFFRILERGGATNISLVTLLIPVSATLLGTAILGERLSANHFGGMAVVFLGLLILDGRLWEARPAFLRRRAPEECPESP